jgi:hypothetical protein
MVALLLAAGGVAAYEATAEDSPKAPPCEHAASQQVGRNHWSEARQRLAPEWPRVIRLCRYSGLNDHPSSVLLRARLVSDPQLVRHLVREFDKLPRFPRGTIACPTDDGRQIVALLAYADEREVVIHARLTGCNAVTNGEEIRTAAGFGNPPAFGPQLLRELERLTARKS